MRYLETEPTRAVPQLPDALRRRVLTRHPVVTLTLVAVALIGAGAGASQWTIDDLVTSERLGAYTLSPDGSKLAWSQSSVVDVDGEETRVSQIWMLATHGGTAVQLTRGSSSATRPSFSPDGSHLAFLSTRSQPGASGKKTKGSQIWVMSTTGGEAWPATTLDRGIASFQWRGNDRLVFLSSEKASFWSGENEKRKDTSIVVDDAERTPPRRLYQVGPDGGGVAPLTENDDWISWFRISPGEQLAVVQAQRSLSYEFDQRIAPRTFLLDLETGDEQPLLEDGRLLPTTVSWQPDGRGFYFVDRYTTHPVYRQATVRHLHHMPVHDGSPGHPSQVELDWPRGLAGPPAAVPDGVVVMLADGVHRRPAFFRRTDTAWTREILEGDHVDSLDTISASTNGSRIAYQHSRATVPYQLYHATLDGRTAGEPEQATSLNADFENKEKGRTEIVEWTGSLEETVEGILLYPLDWQEGEKRPLILQIHGGPTGVDRDTWDPSWGRPIILFRQMGAFVLRVNYHGSGGYGLDWVESIGEGRAYDHETPDVEAGVDYLIDRGLVDPERLGTAGWSYGGIVSADLITKSRRYKAAQVGAADVEWISDWANVDFGAAYDNYYFGGSPWEALDVYIDKSPFFRLREVTTPTLIFTGTEDTNVPPHQSWSLFRALQHETDTPTRLVLFPGEPHSLQKIAHQRRKLEEEMAWFGRHLFEREPEHTESLKDGSLLAGLVGRADALRDGDLLGRREGDLLLPETASFTGLEVSRFEITRSQYASVSGDDFAGNRPVTGLGLAEVRAWIGQLSEHTGRSYRLPTSEEYATLRTVAGAGGNTLDRWAGYAGNPDDTGHLRSLAAGLPGEAPLLLDVGSVAGSGTPMIFDLDGNAAEWALNDDDSGSVEGPSADQPSDTTEPTSDGAYIGFRVVLDDGGV